DPDRFATLSERANWSCFLPTPYKGHTCSCQSVAQQVRCFRGCWGAEGGERPPRRCGDCKSGKIKREPQPGFLTETSYLIRRRAAATGLGIEKTKTIASAMATAILMVSIPLDSAIALSPIMK